MIDGVTLNSSDVRAIIALSRGVPIEAVVPMKYSFMINGMTADEIREKMEKKQ